MTILRLLRELFCAIITGHEYEDGPGRMSDTCLRCGHKP